MRSTAISHVKDVDSGLLPEIAYSRSGVAFNPREDVWRFRDAVTSTLRTDGIDFDVPASYLRERLSWSTSVHLIVPLEVRDEAELRVVADLGKRLLQGKTTIEREFPGYRYGREQWLAECHTMEEDLRLKV
ncbi:MAG: hypothetical protein WA928_00435 [Castellaniella sp.]